MAEQIGRYEIRQEIGRGGMATVYLAFDPRIRRRVAVKVLPRQFTHDPKYLERFEQEAQTIAVLEHPAIVPIHDFGEHEDAPYLVMRYMAGGSLRDRLSGQPLSLQEIAPDLDRLAPALDYAHEVGVIHRDLKPSNILFDYEGRPYLADFGIARLAEASHTMTIVGTPAYMSPEQAESKVKIDGRSDLYALGVMLYELLTGEQPYVAETPTGQMVMHILEPVPDVLKANPDLPPEAQQVIEKAMAKDRDERYQSAAELATAVNALLASETTVKSVPASAPVAAVPVVEDLAAEPDIEAAVSPAEDGLLEVSDEEIAPPQTRPDAGEKEQEAAPVDWEPGHAAPESIRHSSRLASESDVEPLPPRSAPTWRDLPNWVWWAGALALLLIAIMGIRSVFDGGAADEGSAELPEEAMLVAEVAPLEEETPAGQESSIGEVAAPGSELPPIEAELGDTSEREPDHVTEVAPLDEEAPAAEESSIEEEAVVAAAEPPPGAAQGDTWLRPSDGETMVYVPEGSFLMGSERGNNDEVPLHEVSLDAFWIDRTEVTNAQFAEFIDATGHETTAEEKGSSLTYTGAGWEDTAGADWQHPRGPDGDLAGLEDHPVVNVSWNDAQAYCEWAGARLPTGAEYEYVARGPQGLTYPWGDSFDAAKANFCDADCPFEWADKTVADGYVFTAPTGSYPRGESWIGALDMAGNVWEWVNDWYDEAYYANSPARDPQGPDSGELKVLRAGSWGDTEFSLRGANRGPAGTDFKSAGLGFRCVSSAEESVAAEETTADAESPPFEALLGYTWERESDHMTMVYVPEGSFPMGSEEGEGNEAPVHEVFLDAFWIDRTEVTNAQFTDFVDATGHETSVEERGTSWTFVDGEWKKTAGADWRHPHGPESNLDGLAEHPVVHVSWEDAHAYCTWANARLATEAEWEYAARGAEGMTFPWGEEEPHCYLALFSGCADNTTPAGSLPDGASWVGALDMAGNVWEWTNDWFDYDHYAESAERNPQGPVTGTKKVLRGGSLRRSAEDLRGANRATDSPNFSNGNYGIRCVVAPSVIDNGTTADAESPPFEALLGYTWERESDHMTMVHVPEGAFPMGSEAGDSNEVPVHELFLDAFWIDRKEVNNAQYALCVSEGNCEPSSLAGDTIFSGGELPVVGVSWHDAEAYCAWTDARLPTEAEWEYAARGPQGLTYPWGGDEPVCDLAHFVGCGQSAIPVGSLPAGASWVGGLNMAGNVWEWTNDWFGSSYYAGSPGRNPQGPEDGTHKVLRGGAWDYIAHALRGADRDVYKPDDRSVNIGFRCVVSPGN